MTDNRREAPGSGVMFDAVAPRYDILNRILSLGLDQSWRRAAVAALKLDPGGKVLDLATGTGDLVLALAQQSPQSHIVGLDPSRGMLDRCRCKLDEVGVHARVTLVQGDALFLPFEDAHFDAVTMAFGIRNVADRRQALVEIRRVLRPGGRVAILELTEPRGGILGALARFHVRTLVPWLGALLSSPGAYTYLPQSIFKFPAPDVFALEMEVAGFDRPNTRPFTFGACHLFLAVKPG